MSAANGGLDDGFDSQIPQTTAEIRSALASGLLSLDANVLLSFYRFSPTAQKALVEVLEALGDQGLGKVVNHVVRSVSGLRLSAA